MLKLIVGFRDFANAPDKETAVAYRRIVTVHLVCLCVLALTENEAGTGVRSAHARTHTHTHTHHSVIHVVSRNEIQVCVA